MAPGAELPMAPPVEQEPLPDHPSQRRFRIEGMDCGACAQTLQRQVADLDGIETATVSFAAGSMTVDGKAPDREVETAVARAGFRAHPERDNRPGATAAKWHRNPRTISTLAAIPVLLAATTASLLSAPGLSTELLYLVAMAVSGWPIGRAALAAFAVRRLDMNVLMGTAALGAIAIGEFGEGAWVLVLFAIGTSLESFALARTRGAVESLMELAPSQAHLLRDGKEITVPSERVVPGDTILVRPGERLPVDGQVLAGNTSLDQSPVTGESIPVEVGPGDAVYGGSLAVHGALTLEATRPASDSTLSRIAAMVEDAQAKRAPAERFIDRFAAIYTPLVLVAALTLAVLPPLAFGGDAGTWVYRALALLIVACPCSLVISVPVAVVSAIGGAARQGVLVSGGEALENLGRVTLVAFDKTGTLTEGRPELEIVTVLDSALDESAALGLMAALESGSEHPIAAAIRRAAVERGVAVPPAAEFRALPGRGATAVVSGRLLWAGGPRLAEERLGYEPQELALFNQRGQTALVLGAGERPLAIFGLADRMRPEARAAVAGLRDNGVDRTLILSGDSASIARSIAERAAIDEWHAGLLPEQKLELIEQLAGTERGTVGMVGDGINDAPALAAAPIGIAMGSSGSDTALAAADVALLSDRLDRLPGAVARGRRALSIMRANVVASLAVKAVLVALAPFGLVTLVLAVAADMGMSLAVTLNSMRLLRRDRSA